MGDPLKHAQSSARLFGGVPEDYIRIHTLLDSSKLFLADWRHRALLHNTFGIHIFEQLIGSSFNRASDNVAVCTRTVVSQHIMEDLGAIPTPGEFLREMPIQQWMSGINEATKKRMQSLSISENSDMELYIKSSITWNNSSSPPKEFGRYLVALVDGKSVIEAVYFVKRKEWTDATDNTLITNKVCYWANKPLNPIGQ